MAISQCMELNEKDKMMKWAKISFTFTTRRKQLNSSFSCGENISVCISGLLYTRILIYFCVCIHWSHPQPVLVIWLSTHMNAYTSGHWAVLLKLSSLKWPLKGELHDGGIQRAEVNRSRMLSFSVAWCELKEWGT